jgi:hypothetical protein
MPKPRYGSRSVGMWLANLPRLGLPLRQLITRLRGRRRGGGAPGPRPVEGLSYCV